MRIVVILLLLATNLYSQSFFKVSKAGRKGLKIQRTVRTSTSRIDLARKVLERQYFLQEIRQSKTTLRATYFQRERPPLRVVGPNNYLRAAARKFKGRKGWERIEQSGSYNGAHHIVTKFVIKEIGGNSEAIANAPSIFHPLHNDPKYEQVFHNHKKQLEIYKQSGIKGIILDFFNNVDGFNQEEIDMIMLEAEFWSKHWKFRWE